ncbi:MAG: type II CAAX prenyl endopeptidase Rce1 family protein, partial [Promethearchaeota archaeon]
MLLGENPWVLIGLTLLEIIFIIVPAFITSKFERKPFKEIIIEMGFQKNEDVFLKIISGLSISIVFFFLSGYILAFFRDIIVGSIFGAEFIMDAQEGSINTTPIQPNFTQLIILIVLQIMIVGPCEEGFFRGFLIKKLKVKLKLIYSIIISSIVFTLYHVPPFLVPITTILTFSGYYFTFGLLLSL